MLQNNNLPKQQHRFKTQVSYLPNNNPEAQTTTQKELTTTQSFIFFFPFSKIKVSFLKLI
jgi:hypothetical protein